MRILFVSLVAASMLPLAGHAQHVTGQGIDRASSNMRLENEFDVFRTNQDGIDQTQNVRLEALEARDAELNARTSKNEGDIHQLFQTINNLDLTCSLDQYQLTDKCQPCITGLKYPACKPGYSASIAQTPCGSSGKQQFCIPSTTCTAMKCQMYK